MAERLSFAPDHGAENADWMKAQPGGWDLPTDVDAFLSYIAKSSGATSKFDTYLAISRFIATKPVAKRMPAELRGELDERGMLPEMKRFSEVAKAWSEEDEAAVSKHMGPGPHPDGSPQSVHGKKRGRGLVNEAMKNPPGQRGYTYSRKQNAFASEGMALSVFPQHEVIVQPGEDLVAAVDAFVDEHAAFVRDNDNVFFGAWLNDEDGTRPVSESPLVLDLSIVVNDPEEVIRLGNHYKQEAYYDLATGETVRLDSFGARSISKRGHLIFFRPERPSRPSSLGGPPS